MKDTIYTIPVTEVFQMDCECPFCELETKLEDELASDVLGASLMEPAIRKETNKKGFCRKHFELLYNKQENRLGFGLILSTHLQELNDSFGKIVKSSISASNSNDQPASLFKKSKGSNNIKSKLDKIIDFIDEYETKCYICDRLDFTIDRYIDTMFYLYFSEKDFRNLFLSSKGFCLHHLKLILEYAKKLDSKKTSDIIPVILDMQKENLKRIQDETEWFTKKFDYKNEDEPWGNSKDAIPRTIKKLSGPARLR